MKFASSLSVPLTLALLAILHQPVAQAAGVPFDISDGDVAGLIAAINAANLTPDADTINLASGGTYTLTATDNTFRGASGLPRIVTPITINGNGATIKRSSASGTPDFRIFLVTGFPWAGGDGNLTLNDLTITGGRLPGSDGGGLMNSRGTARLERCTITGNSGSHGGGINHEGGRLTVLNSTISHNTATSYGGGLKVNYLDPAYVAIIDSTIFENRAMFGDAVAAPDSYSPPGKIVLKNSILASPSSTVDDFSVLPGLVKSLGHNIVGDTSGALGGTGDVNGVDPQLGPLADNGGLTWTHAPLPGSPVLDAVPTAESTDEWGAVIATDQRGVARPQGAACDIGSVEALRCGGAIGCPDGQFCKRELGECAADREGVCTDTLSACQLAYIPACGCDGRTYANACMANSAGVTVDHEGECEAADPDTTPPTITYALTPPTPDGANGWYKSDVTLVWSVTDSESTVTKIACIDQHITADQGVTTYTCSATSAGGSSGPVDVVIKRDATAPTVSLAGGGNYPFGYLPATGPICSASDALSGLDGNCTVSGYDPNFPQGSHLVIATAKDQAGNESGAYTNYAVRPWTLIGFDELVAIPSLNGVNSKRTVAINFEVFSDSTMTTELNDPSFTVHSVTAEKFSCPLGSPIIDITKYGSGNKTELKYKTPPGKFIYSWVPPKNEVGNCYVVTINLKDGGNVINPKWTTSKSVFFRLK